MTCGHLRKTCPTKIHRINGHLVGCAGSAAQNRAFIEWFGNQSKPFPEFGDSHALVIRPDGTAWFYEGSNSPLQICGKAAIGSGGDFALAAMATGANAIEAVKIAEQLDIYCGGEIKSLKLDAPKK
jgi:ATP-dependent protease HslVU (ClpYQ) peptidase subunit